VCVCVHGEYGERAQLLSDIQLEIVERSTVTQSYNLYSTDNCYGMW
jgi:hypothetical protein